MVHPYAAPGFLAAVLSLAATPGAGPALLVQHVTDNGRRQALPVVLGTATGLYIHAALATAGLSALAMHSGQAFMAVKVVGAAHLIVLGTWTWRSTRATARAPAPRRLPVQSESVCSQPLFADVLDPKAASIHLTPVPRFIPPDHSFGGQILVLATAHALLMTLGLLAWTALIQRASHALRKPRSKRATAKTTAVVLLALGIRTAAPWAGISTWPRKTFGTQPDIVINAAYRKADRATTLLPGGRAIGCPP
ncbi:LysE family translocator [Streptomyces kebangsaanensis]|uniref:LysE family translocator n=1 Tax=Streptomyces kebangsaanensis TaxID=864058 RepID=UPI00094062F8|nr:LysE family translocator [Streptomyces kebangsaanensis]